MSSKNTTSSSSELELKIDASLLEVAEAETLNQKRKAYKLQQNREIQHRLVSLKQSLLAQGMPLSVRKKRIMEFDGLFLKILVSAAVKIHNRKLKQDAILGQLTGGSTASSSSFLTETDALLVIQQLSKETALDSSFMLVEPEDRKIMLALIGDIALETHVILENDFARKEKAAEKQKYCFDAEADDNAVEDNSEPKRNKRNCL